MNTKLDSHVVPDLSNEFAEWIDAFDHVVVAEGPEQGLRSSRLCDRGLVKLVSTCRVPAPRFPVSSDRYDRPLEEDDSILGGNSMWIESKQSGWLMRIPCGPSI